MNVFRILLAAQRRPAAQIEIVCGDIFRGVSRAAAVRHFGLQDVGKFCVNLIFQCQQITGDAGKFLAPLQAIVDHVFEVDDDAELVSGALHQAMNDVIDAQILGDAWQRCFLIVGFGRGGDGSDAHV